MNLPSTRRNPYGADWAVERNVGDAQRDGCAVNAGDIRIVFRVGGEHHRDDLGLAAEALGEQRPDGTIDLAAGQDLALAGTAFALDETARNASGGISVFAVVNGKREEVNAFPRFGIGTSGSQNNVIAHANNAGTMCLLR